MTHRNGFLWYAFLCLCLLAATVVFLAVWGRSARAIGPASTVGQGKTELVSVARPEEAFQVWQRLGYRGRVVVTFSRWLNFLETGETRLIPATSPFPLQVGNLSRMAERELAKENFLYIAMKSGIARELIQVVPESEMAVKNAAAAAEGVAPRNGMLKLPVLGSPRTITSPRFFLPPREPALLYVNASFFRDVEPVELFRLLVRSRVATDCVVLALSTDDREVSSRERERLMAFKGLLEAAHDRR